MPRARAERPDLEKASALFRKAAERGVRDSQFNLAILHARGLGVPQDLVEAYKWFGIAASSGDEESAKRRDIIGGSALRRTTRPRRSRPSPRSSPCRSSPEANEVQIPKGGWQDSDNSTSINMSDQNELVALVQKLLAQNGYDPGPPDGLLGEADDRRDRRLPGKGRPAADRADRHRPRGGAAGQLDLRS